jgi:hypothetical protein
MGRGARALLRRARVRDGDEGGAAGGCPARHPHPRTVRPRDVLGGGLDGLPALCSGAGAWEVAAHRQGSSSCSKLLFDDGFKLRLAPGFPPHARKHGTAGQRTTNHTPNIDTQASPHACGVPATVASSAAPSKVPLKGTNSASGSATHRPTRGLETVRKQRRCGARGPPRRGPEGLPASPAPAAEEEVRPDPGGVCQRTSAKHKDRRREMRGAFALTCAEGASEPPSTAARVGRTGGITSCSATRCPAYAPPHNSLIRLPMFTARSLGAERLAYS